MKQTNPFLKKLTKNPLVLAPLDAYSDLSFREICEKDTGYTVSEMISSDALIRNKAPLYRYQKGKLKFNVVQIFGNNPQIMAESAQILEEQADAIDINFGCPSPRLNNNQQGSALLKNPKKIEEIIEKIVKKTKLPVSAKIRIGYSNYNHIEIAKKVENANANLITIHGRTKKQGYSGHANWEKIYETKQELKIPVIGNGDINKNSDLEKLKKVDGLMIGRAAMGNPLIFKQILKPKTQINLEKQKKLFKKYIKKLEYYQQTNLKTLKLQACQFFKGYENSKKLKIEILKSKNINDIKKTLEI